MAIQGIGTASATPAAARYAVTPASRPTATENQGFSAASTIVVGKVTTTNPDGSTTITITYADGHTETETTPTKLSGKQPGGAPSASGQSGPASAPPASGGRDSLARGTLVDLLA